MPPIVRAWQDPPANRGRPRLLPTRPDVLRSHLSSAAQSHHCCSLGLDVHLNARQSCGVCWHGALAELVCSVRCHQLSGSTMTEHDRTPWLHFPRAGKETYQRVGGCPKPLLESS